MTGARLLADTMARVGQSLPTQLDDAVALRHLVHANPCLSGREAPTAAAVRRALPADATVEPVADTGLVLRVGGPGQAVGVRAELDALPVTERTEAPWASPTTAMHACGHDVHLAGAVALAHAVHEAPGAVPIAVVLQPREETSPSGARDIVDSGALDRHQIAAMVGAHVQPQLPHGTVACVPGAVNASSDEFTVTMHGRGGHAAYPQLTADPVLALSQFVVAAQQLVARNADPMVPAVVSVTGLSAGDTSNVVPDHAVAHGTVRSMTEEQRHVLHERLAVIADGIAHTHGCAVEVDADVGEPVLFNDDILTAHTVEHLRSCGFVVETSLRSCGADDFAYYGASVPSLMMYVGVDADGAGLHHATFLPPDASVGSVAGALFAGYRAAAERLPQTGE